MIKKFILISLVFILSLSLAYGYICCRDYQTNQQRCFIDGECCSGFWYEDCEGFEIWSDNQRAVIGMEKPVNIYIRNTGGYTFDFKISSYQTNSDNIIVNLPSHSTSIGSRMTGYLQPKIFLKSQTTHPIPVTFTVTNGHITKEITVNISSEEYFTLSEYGIFALLILLTFSAIYINFSKV